MKLLTSELRKKLPKLGATDGTQDPLCQAKFFTPDGSWTWFATVRSERHLLRRGVWSRIRIRVCAPHDGMSDCTSRAAG